MCARQRRRHERGAQAEPGGVRDETLRTRRVAGLSLAVRAEIHSQEAALLLALSTTLPKVQPGLTEGYRTTITTSPPASGRARPPTRTGTARRPSTST